MENGRIVVVTGGAGGIGSKIVDRFLANGDMIFAIGNRSDAHKTLLQTRNAEDRLVAVEGDVSKEDHSRRQQGMRGVIRISVEQSQRLGGKTSLWAA